MFVWYNKCRMNSDGQRINGFSDYFGGGEESRDSFQYSFEECCFQDLFLGGVVIADYSHAKNKLIICERYF